MDVIDVDKELFDLGHSFSSLSPEEIVPSEGRVTSYYSDEKMDDLNSNRRIVNVYLYQKTRFQPDDCYVLKSVIPFYNVSYKRARRYVDKLNEVFSYALDEIKVSLYPPDHVPMVNEVNVELKLFDYE